MTVAVVVTGVLLIGPGIANLMGDKPFLGVTASDMQNECKQAVADWAGVDVKEVSSNDRSQGTGSLDFNGKYPGGEWDCGGRAGEVEPLYLTVYPDDESLPVEHLRGAGSGE